MRDRVALNVSASGASSARWGVASNPASTPTSRRRSTGARRRATPYRRTAARPVLSANVCGRVTSTFRTPSPSPWKGLFQVEEKLEPDSIMLIVF